MTEFTDFVENQIFKLDDVKVIVKNIENQFNLTFNTVTFKDLDVTFKTSDMVLMGKLSYDIYQLTPIITFNSEQLKYLKFYNRCLALIEHSQKKLSIFYRRSNWHFIVNYAMSFTFYKDSSQLNLYMPVKDGCKTFNIPLSDFTVDSNPFLKAFCYKVFQDGVIKDVADFEAIYDNIQSFIDIAEMIEK